MGKEKWRREKEDWDDKELEKFVDEGVMTENKKEESLNRRKMREAQERRMKDRVSQEEVDDMFLEMMGVGPKD